MNADEWAPLDVVVERVALIRTILDRYDVPLPKDECFARVLAANIPAAGVPSPLTLQGVVERVCMRTASRAGILHDPAAYALATFRSLVRGESMMVKAVRKKRPPVPTYEPPVPSLRADYTDEEWDAHLRRGEAKRVYQHRHCRRPCILGCPAPDDPQMAYPRWAFEGWYSPTEKFPPNHAPPPRAVLVGRPRF